MLDKEGQPLYDSQQRADRFFEHFCDVESGRPVQPKQLLQDAFALQLRQFDKLPIPDAKLLASRQDLEDAFRTSKDGGFGEDAIPNGIFRLAPDVFAWLLHPLALKITALAMEPVSFKGGMLYSLYKGKGPHADCGSYRGI